MTKHSHLKEIIAFLGMAALIIGVIAAVALSRRSQDNRQRAATTGVAITLMTTSGNKAIGDDVVVNVNLNTAGLSATAADLYVSYDSTALQYTSASNGTVMPLTLQAATAEGGVVHMTVGVNPGSPVTDTGSSIANLHFKALKNGTSDVVLGSNSQVSAVDHTENVLSSYGTVGIAVGSLASASPTTSPTPSFVVGYGSGLGANVVLDMTMTGYNVSVVLTDAQGAFITNQADYTYSWSTSDNDVVSLSPQANCINGVVEPCPYAWATLVPHKLGTAVVNVTVTKLSTQDSRTQPFFITVNQGSTPQPSPASTAPPGCHYENVQCVENAPCGPTLVCPLPSPSSTPGEVVMGFTFKVKIAGVNSDVGPIKAVVTVSDRNNPSIVFSHDQTLTYLDGYYVDTFKETARDPAVFDFSKGFAIAIKAEKHVKRVFASNAVARESDVLDLTSKPLQPGDLPEQDGVVNSEDIAKVLKDMVKPIQTAEDLKEADVNYDGVVNSFDMGLILSTLSTRPDETL